MTDSQGKTSAKCGKCGGDGWTGEADHAPMNTHDPRHDPRDGSCRICPVWVQVPCEACNGTGKTLSTLTEQEGAL